MTLIVPIRSDRAYTAFGKQSVQGTAVVPSLFPRWVDGSSLEVDAKMEDIWEGDGSRRLSFIIKNMQQVKIKHMCYVRPNEAAFFEAAVAGFGSDTYTGPATGGSITTTGATNVAGATALALSASTGLTAAGTAVLVVNPGGSTEEVVTISTPNPPTESSITATTVASTALTATFQQLHSGTSHIGYYIATTVSNPGATPTTLTPASMTGLTVGQVLKLQGCGADSAVSDTVTITVVGASTITITGASGTYTVTANLTSVAYLTATTTTTVGTQQVLAMASTVGIAQGDFVLLENLVGNGATGAFAGGSEVVYVQAVSANTSITVSPTLVHTSTYAVVPFTKTTFSTAVTAKGVPTTVTLTSGTGWNTGQTGIYVWNITANVFAITVPATGLKNTHAASETVEGPASHVITDQVDGAYYTIEFSLGDTAGIIIRVRDCKCESLKRGAKAGSLVSYETEWSGLACIVEASPLSPTFDMHQPFLYTQGVWTLDGSTTNDGYAVDTFDVTTKNNLDVVQTERLIGDAIIYGNINLDMTLQVVYQNGNRIEDVYFGGAGGTADSQTVYPGTLVLLFTEADNFHILQYSIPTLNYTKTDVPQPKHDGKAWRQSIAASSISNMSANTYLMQTTVQDTTYSAN